MGEIVDRLVSIWDSLPPSLKAAIVLVIGWLAAFVVRLVISRLLMLIRFDKLGKRAGLSDFLRKGHVKYSPSQLAGVIAYWISLLSVFLLVARILDVEIYRALSGKLVQALPNMFSGVLVAVVGYLVVSFIANFILTIALNASMKSANLLSKAIKWLGVIVVVTMALEQIGLGRSLVEFIFQVLLGSFAFGAALAFGLGCKDMAKEFLQRLIRNLHEQEREAGKQDLEG
jgi:hypothetical protein